MSKCKPSMEFKRDRCAEAKMLIDLFGERWVLKVNNDL